MASEPSPKGTTVGTGVCCSLGALLGGAVGSMLGANWAPPVAALGAVVGTKTAGTVR